MSHHLIPLKSLKPPLPNAAIHLSSLTPQTVLLVWDKTPSTHRNHKTPQRAKSVSKEDRQPVNAICFCTDILVQSNIDHRMKKKSLTPLMSLKNVNNKKISNPYLFRGVSIVTIFGCLISYQTKELWKLIEGASLADMRLAEMEYPSVKKMLTHCASRFPIYVHPCFYRSLKLRYPLDVGGISRDDRFTTELGTGSLGQAVGILTTEDFWSVVDGE